MAKILIVDPETRITEVLKKVLTAAGHQVETVQNRKDAAEHLEAGALDLIVADAQDNLPLLESIPQRGERPLVIMTSLLPDKESVLRALRGGAFRFLTKPISVKALQATIEEGLEELSAQDRAGAKA